MSGLGRVLLAECGRTEDLDLFLRGQLDAFAACVHQFLHCLDGALQPLDVGVGVAVVARRGTDARHHQTDVVIVVEGAHGETRQGGYRADGVGVHAATIDPDAA